MCIFFFFFFFFFSKENNRMSLTFILLKGLLGALRVMRNFMVILSFKALATMTFV